MHKNMHKNSIMAVSNCLVLRGLIFSTYLRVDCPVYLIGHSSEFQNQRIYEVVKQ